MTGFPLIAVPLWITLLKSRFAWPGRPEKQGIHWHPPLLCKSSKALKIKGLQTSPR
ncbi:hypothetical protein CBM2618_A290132 [Cupriavidus taiwanensis]|nr:hypothetical protein CBM2618_A290132 [Cupriavidus taiwanensis]